MIYALMAVLSLGVAVSTTSGSSSSDKEEIDRSFFENGSENCRP